MIKVRYKQFLIEPSVNSYQFDLSEEIEYRKIGEGTREDPKGEISTRYDNLGYDMTFERCVEKIVKILASEGEEVIEIQELLSRYQAIFKEIKEEFKSVKFSK